MKDITTNKWMKTMLLDKGEKVLVKENDLQFYPNECHIIPDGSTNGKASVVIVAVHEEIQNRVLIQFSKETLGDMIKALSELP